MKTSYSQFTQLVEFMERNGDLSKPSGGVRGRQWCAKKWQELANLLNSDGTGDNRNDDKWRKVWSDLKNNTKKKAARVKRSLTGTGGGPAIKALLTDLEERVLQIIGEQAATGMPSVQEAGFSGQESIEVSLPAVTMASSPLTVTVDVIGDESWNFPSGSQVPAPTVLGIEENEPADVPRDETFQSQPRRRKSQNQKNHDVDVRNQFLENERERDRRYFELEKERLRQRDVELKLQAQWLEFMKEALRVVASLVEGKKMDE